MRLIALWDGTSATASDLDGHRVSTMVELMRMMGGIVDHLLQPSGILGDSGLTSLGGEIYIANRNQGIARVDPQFGTSTFFFGPEGIEALGNNAVNLLAGLFHRDTVLEYATDGTLLTTIDLMSPQTIGTSRLPVTIRLTSCGAPPERPSLCYSGISGSAPAFARSRIAM